MLPKEGPNTELGKPSSISVVFIIINSGKTANFVLELLTLGQFPPSTLERCNKL